MKNQKNLQVEISENLGNQLFMYAHGFALSKYLNRKLYIDNKTSYSHRKNIGSYRLNNFNISGKVISNKNNNLFNFKNLRRKALLKIDIFKKDKIFFIEKRNKKKKTRYYNENFLRKNNNNTIYVKGYFESEKYFSKNRKEILKEFSFKNKKKYQNNKYYKYILNNNVVAIVVRQNRYNERNIFQKNNSLLKNKSKTFLEKQIKFIKKSIIYFKKKINNPKFLIWSNDFTNLNNYFSKDFLFVKNRKINKDLLDLYLLTNCKYFIVSPSTFSWWGAWLSIRKGKICVRPKNLNVSNNKDFWPKEWISL